MRLLVWHWGRYGAGPRYAAALARHLNGVAGLETILSLSAGAEILGAADPPRSGLTVPTYAGPIGFAGRMAAAPFAVPGLARRLRELRVDAALCAMPALLDGQMAAALRRIGAPMAVVVHDAEPHPGERMPLQHRLQRRLVRRADLLVALSGHVAARLRGLGTSSGKPMVTAALPPLHYGAVPPLGRHGGALRLLCFGRLLPYKGLDLLADALPRAGNLTLRVVGQGPDSPVLDQLRALPDVTVENRWVPEAEMTDLLAWSDALVLPYREASQSGVAAAALAAGRPVVATRVGGLVEQLAGEAMAILCDPDPASLAAAIGRLPGLPRARPPEPEAAWRAMAGELGPVLAEALRHRRC